MDVVLIRDSINRVIPRIPLLLLEVLDENEAFIQKLINDQLAQGQRGDGQVITPQYSEAYAKKKGITIPDLKLTGEFYKSIFTEIADKVLLIDTNRVEGGFALGQHLLKRYTDKILELTQQSLVKLKEKVVPQLINKVNNEIIG